MNDFKKSSVFEKGWCTSVRNVPFRLDRPMENCIPVVFKPVPEQPGLVCKGIAVLDNPLYGITLC